MRLVNLFKGKNMKNQFLVTILTLAVFTLLPASEVMAQQSSTPPQPLLRNWGLAFTRYSEQREGYEFLPIQVRGIRGGKLGPQEKFKIVVYSLKNLSPKPVNALKLAWYLFDNNDLNTAVQSGLTPLIKIDLPSNEPRDVDILVVNVEDIPLLRDGNPSASYMLEVGIGEVHYDDGSTWDATALPLPGKFDASKQPWLQPSPRLD